MSSTHSASDSSLVVHNSHQQAVAFSFPSVMALPVISAQLNYEDMFQLHSLPARAAGRHRVRCDQHGFELFGRIPTPRGAQTIGRAIAETEEAVNFLNKSCGQYKLVIDCCNRDTGGALLATPI